MAYANSHLQASWGQFLDVGDSLEGLGFFGSLGAVGGPEAPESA